MAGEDRGTRKVARLTHDAVAENLRALGFVRVLADGTPLHLDELPPGVDFTRAGELLVIVDRLVAEPAAAGRITESVATAFQEGEGAAIVLVPYAARAVTFPGGVSDTLIVPDPTKPQVV